MDNNFGTYPLADEEKSAKKEAYKKAMEEALINGAAKSSIILIPTIIYAILTTIFLYGNFSGITMPLYAVVTTFYVRYIYIKLRPESNIKNGFYLYALGIFFLAISDVITANDFLHYMNNMMIVILIVGMVMYLFLDEKNWTLVKYAAVFLEATFGALSSVSDLVSDTIAAITLNKSEKTKTFIYCIIGVAVFIPVGSVIIALLCSADVVFETLLSDMFKRFDFATMIGIIFFFLFAVICTYCGIRNIDKNQIRETVHDTRYLPIAVANTVLTLIGIVYLLFSVVQIGSLFVGKMQLPDGYTYAEYIHEGYYQLIAVCLINLFMVLFTKGFFKNHISTKLLLTLVSACTYIMIASASMRLVMYVKAYNLTTLRIEVAWSLVMIGLAMAFITVSVYKEDLKLMHFLTAIAVIGLVVLSVIRPDAMAVKYNIGAGNTDSYEYINNMSADAAPYILEIDDDFYVKELYVNRIKVYLEERKGIRKFNLSRYIAKKALEN